MTRKPESEKAYYSLYEKLNPDQKVAVDSIEGPVLVIAGPGTGKTQVLTMRIANILLKTDTPSSAILALTFTESGVRAMRERLLSIIGPEAYYVNICTFHSFCSDILKSNPDKFLLSEDLEPLSDLERVQVFREILDQNSFKTIRPFGNKYYYVKALIKTIQVLKREGITPEDFEKFLKSVELPEKEAAKLAETSQVYRIYQQKITERGRYDFEDMITLVTEVLEEDQELLRDYQERFLYILVDEYQDTNSPQNKVVRLLSSYWGEDANIFAVGDDSQSIYRFQGASLENILFFTRAFPRSKVVTLKDNYRSQSLVIAAAEDVISNNEMTLTKVIKNVDKTQKSASGYPDSEISIGHFSSGVTESFFVAHKIKELISKGVPPAEIAVIYRNNADSKDFSDMLSRMGVPFNLIGGENILEDHDINKLLKLFEVILKVRSKDEDIDLFTLLNYNFIGFDYVDTLKLARFASERKINFVEAIEHPEFEERSFIKDTKRFKDFLAKLCSWQELDSNLVFVEFFERVLEESGFLNWVLRSYDVIEKLNRLNSLFSEIKRLNIADHSLNLFKFMENVSILRDSNIAINEEDLNIRTNSVLLTTAHRAKGLEFEYVFIVKCFDGKWGNNKSRELIKLPEGLIDLSLEQEVQKIVDKDGASKSKERNEDERRLFYVALTRAKKEAFITYSDSYLVDGYGKEAVPSMFISEVSSNRKKEIEVSSYESSVKEILKDLLKPASQENVTVEEKDFLRSIIRNFSLSVTALNTYLECGYKFKLKHLLRTPRATNKFLAFGTAVHAALEEFFRQFKSGGKDPGKKFLLDKFMDAMNLEILAKYDVDECKEKGELILSGYYEVNKSNFKIPLFVEKFFGYGNGKIFLEDIPLTGKIDRIELIDSEKKLVKVTDYKTGAAKSRNEIDGLTKYSDGSEKRQLVFYKLLADLDRTFNYKVGEAELDFIETKNGKYIRESFNITDEEVEKLKATIREVMIKIRSLEFPRTTNYATCATCEFKAHCWPDGIPVKNQLELEI